MVSFFQLVPHNHLSESSSPLCIATSHLCPSFTAVCLSLALYHYGPVHPLPHLYLPSTLPLTTVLSLDHLFTTPARPGDLLAVSISTTARVVPDCKALAPKWRPSSPLLPSEGTRHDYSATGRLPPVPALTSAPRPCPLSALLTKAAQLATLAVRHYHPLAHLVCNVGRWRASRRDRGSKTPGRECSRNRKLPRSSRPPPAPLLPSRLVCVTGALRT